VAGPARRVAATVRFRVTALATVTVAAVLVVTAVGLTLAQERLLTRNLEDALHQRADDVEALVRAGRVPPTLAAGDEDDLITQVVGPSGRVLASSPNMTGRAPVAAAPAADEAGQLRTVDLPVDDSSFRLLSRTVEGSGGPVVVHVAAALDDIGESTTLLAGSLALVVPVVTAVLGALIWWLVGRSLAPVEVIRAEVADIAGTDLHRRVPEPKSGDEVARLARTMNGMLDRVEDAVRRQQRFVADASHELRSPLTRIRSELEVDLAHPGGADPLATHRSVLDETTGLQRLIEDLLHLAQADAGTATLRRAPVDLDDIVLRHARRLREGGRATVDTRGVAAAQVEGDADQLSRAVGNLADNAARHARTTVTFTLAERDGHAVLTVSDDGAGIPPGQHERVFERFTRLDPSRTSGAGGTGLGLAIARDILRRHGGTVAADPAHGPGARFVLTLPSAG
jgi:signal transduction histidine kinase